jgi:hypothetical protein
MATKAEQLVSMEYVKECVALKDGLLYWKRRPAEHFKRKQKDRAETLAGTVTAQGYTRVCIAKDGKRHYLLAHRIIWMLHHGAWPTQIIDHINRNPSDNRIENLRDVANDENLRNNGNANGTGLKGAHRLKRGGSNPFVAHITLDGIQRYLGVFSTAEEAHQAHLNAARAK